MIALPFHEIEATFFRLESPQPIEKSQFGRRNPSESKEFFLGFPWFCLVWLGLAWTGLEKFGLRRGADAGPMRSAKLRGARPTSLAPSSNRVVMNSRKTEAPVASKERLG
jgi:hypothetical protein